MLQRVSSVGNVLVVPPFECAWLSGNQHTLRNGSGCVLFEAKGDTDVTIILKSTPGAKRWQPLVSQRPQQAPQADQAAPLGAGAVAAGAAGVLVEENYTIILGSHRNTCLKFEKNGRTYCSEHDVPGAHVSSREFLRFWVDYNRGAITVGSGGEPGQGACFRWQDPEGEIPNIQHVGLSCWDRHVSYRSIQVLPALTAAALLPALTAGSPSAPSMVSTLFDAASGAAAAACCTEDVCMMMRVAELLLPTTRALYRHGLSFLAAHFSEVISSHAADAAQLSPALMHDLLQHPALVAEERAIYNAAAAWAISVLCISSPAQADSPAVQVVAATIATATAITAAATPTPPASATATGTVPLVEAHAATTSTSYELPQAQHPTDMQVDFGQTPSAIRHMDGGTPHGHLDEHSHCCQMQDADASSSGVPHSVASALPAHLPSSDAQLPYAPCTCLPDSDALTASALQALTLPSGWCGQSRASDRGIDFRIMAASKLLEEEVSRVMELVRYPLIAPAELRRLLNAPLVQRLPAVLALIREALGVREAISCVVAPSGLAADQPGALSEADVPVCFPATGTVASAGGAAGPTAAAPETSSASSSGRGGALFSVEHRRLVKPADAQGALHFVRYQHRYLPLGTELSYVSDGDCNGVFHYLGTAGGTKQWSHPVLSKLVDVRASSPTCRTTDPKALLGGHFLRTNFAGPRHVSSSAPAMPPAGGSRSNGRAQSASLDGPKGDRSSAPQGLQAATSMPLLPAQTPVSSESADPAAAAGPSPMVCSTLDSAAGPSESSDTRPVADTRPAVDNRTAAGPCPMACSTSGSAGGAWWAVDLRDHELIPTFYSMRHDGSQDYARHWALQGSHDALAWLDLRRHSNDSRLQVPGQWASFPVGAAAGISGAGVNAAELANSVGAFRHFRVLLTGPTTSRTQPHNFNLSAFELYGYIFKAGTIASSTASKAAPLAACT